MNSNTDYYNNMPQDFKDAVNVIKKYCQNEDCQDYECSDCPYSLKVIRCGDANVNLDEVFPDNLIEKIVDFITEYDTTIEQAIILKDRELLEQCVKEYVERR